MRELGKRYGNLRKQVARLKVKARKIRRAKSKKEVIKEVIAG